MAELKEITQKIRELKVLAEIDLDGVPYRERHGAEGLRRQHQRELAEAQAQLSTAVKGSLIGLFLNGKTEDCLKFSEIAEDEGAAVTVNARDLYRRLAVTAMGSETPSRFQFGVNEIGRLLGGIQSIAARCRVGLPMMNLGKMAGSVFSSMEEVADEIYTKAVYPYLGDELNVVYLQSKVVEEIGKADYELSTVPVVVLEATPDEQKGVLSGEFMFPRGNLAVDVGSNPDRDTVIRAFKELKEINKGKKARKVTKGQ